MAGNTTQFMNAKLASDKPIFIKAKVNHTPPHPVTQLLASNKKIVLVLANKSIQRIDQKKVEENMETIDMTKHFNGLKYKVHLAFMDPTGNHLLVSLKSSDAENLPDLLYFPPSTPGRNVQQTKPKMSTKIRGHLVTAVAWSTQNSSLTTTGPILMGTTRGLIYEAELSTETTMFSSASIEKQWKQVYDLGKGGQVCAITSLEYHRIPKSKRFVILVSTCTRLYQFSGVVSGDPDTERPLLTHIFTDYLQVSDPYIELPNSLKYSALSFYYEPKESGKMAAKLPLYALSFAWMTSEGIFHGKINPFEEDRTNFSKGCQLIQINQQQPLGLILTEFHAIVAYANHVEGICLLNEQVVFEDELDSVIKGIARDPVSGTIYVFAEYSVHKYNIDHEEKHIWKVFLERGDYEKALKYCRDDEQMDQVRLFCEIIYEENSKWIGFSGLDQTGFRSLRSRPLR